MSTTLMQKHSLVGISNHYVTGESAEAMTFRQILASRFSLACFCPGCRRTAACSLEFLMANGLGDSETSACRPKCRKCGHKGEWRIGNDRHLAWREPRHS